MRYLCQGIHYAIETKASPKDPREFFNLQPLCKVFRRDDHFQMHTMQCATDSNFVPSFCTLQSSLDTELLPSLDAEPLPSLDTEPLSKLDTELLPSLYTEPLSSLDTEPLPSLATKPLSSLDENRSQNKGAAYKQKSRAVK